MMGQKDEQGRGKRPMQQKKKKLQKEDCVAG